MAAILWQDISTGAVDRCQLDVGLDGLRIAGTVLTPAMVTRFSRRPRRLSTRLRRLVPIARLPRLITRGG
ncbi:MAG TPA: hypothetical protein VJ625_12035 [Propionibacteriaceae bacterium]|nr:hypothetical protein [Propionibacteriaceae bacterium]